MEVSIIIPVYNAESTVRRCVESLIYGEHNDIEIILIDDCSKDDSYAECLEIAAQYEQVRLLKNAVNKGVSYSRNIGVSTAQGKWILFVDSDDWVSGKYIRKMVETAEMNMESLPVCGYHYLNYVDGTCHDHVWDINKTDTIDVEKKAFFSLCDRVLMQQLWNKVFNTEIINCFNIRFDETQSMGEDFQFVLDYMEAAKVQKCTIINEPLYYYIRANNTSLMGKFGLIENQNEYSRLTQLMKICGEDNIEVQNNYLEAVHNLKNNYIYQAMHSNKSRNEKLSFIENVLQDGLAKKRYRDLQIVIIKEKAALLIRKVRTLPKRLYGRLQRDFRSLKIQSMKKLLKKTDFSVISQNCIGGVFYHDMGLKFTSPTINLFFEASDFVKFVLNLEYYISCDLHMTWGETYPIGYLDDVKVCFMHYKTCAEAKEKWDERKKRINWEKIIIVDTDMEGFNDKVYEQWKMISYSKVLFTSNIKYTDSAVLVKKYLKQGTVSDLISDREFYRKNRLIDIANY